MTVKVKVCGLKTTEALDAAVTSGAAMVGLNFFERSPRYVPYDQAKSLAERTPSHVQAVGLVVNPDDDTIAELIARVPLDIIQLHGSEDPARAAEIHERFGLPVMKALGISSADDLRTAQSYKGAAQYLLLDAKPPKGSDRPGGNAVSFDWTILNGWMAPMPWLLAGGLTVDNVGEAISVSGAGWVDVSSGVESAPGEKDVDLIAQFIAASEPKQQQTGIWTGFNLRA